MTVGKIHEHTLTTLQRDLACDDRRAHRFITQFDNDFHFEVFKHTPDLVFSSSSDGWKNIFFIDVAERLFGKKAVVRTLDALYKIWLENGCRKTDDWKAEVVEVFGNLTPEKNLYSVLTNDAIGVNSFDNVVHDPFPKRYFSGTIYRNDTFMRKG